MIDDIITYDTWRHLCQKYLLTLIITNLRWHKMCKKDVFPPITLIIAHITMAYRNLWGNVWCYKFNSLNSAKHLKFYCRNVESTRNGKLRMLWILTLHYACLYFWLICEFFNQFWHLSLSQLTSLAVLPDLIGEYTEVFTRKYFISIVVLFFSGLGETIA